MSKAVGRDKDPVTCASMLLRYSARYEAVGSTCFGCMGMMHMDVVSIYIRYGYVKGFASVSQIAIRYKSRMVHMQTVHVLWNIERTCMLPHRMHDCIY